MQYEFRHIRVDGMDGADLAYVDQGHGVPVIFLHGSGPTDLRTWGQQIEPFAERHRVIAYSRRCHYPSAWVGDGSNIMSTLVQASDLAALITRLKLERVHLIGASYGADIALRFAVEHPELLRTLVVAEPELASWLAALRGGLELFSEFASDLIDAKRAAQSGDLERGARLFVDAVMGQGVFDELPPDLHGRLMANARLIGYEPTEVAEFITDITREEGASIQTPTLILTGDASPPMFLLVSQDLARYVPHAERAEIGGASHLLHVMNPRAYNATVMAFLAKHAH